MVYRAASNVTLNVVGPFRMECLQVLLVQQLQAAGGSPFNEMKHSCSY